MAAVPNYDSSVKVTDSHIPDREHCHVEIGEEKKFYKDAEFGSYEIGGECFYEVYLYFKVSHRSDIEARIKEEANKWISRLEAILYGIEPGSHIDPINTYTYILSDLKVLGNYKATVMENKDMGGVMIYGSLIYTTTINN